jgi:hypothetical protein
MIIQLEHLTIEDSHMVFVAIVDYYLNLILLLLLMMSNIAMSISTPIDGQPTTAHKQ